jgi:hypothetical protein
MIITPDSQDHWLQLRTQDVTSTESAALFGMSPYVTQFELWHRKKSGEQPEFKTNERMRWGNRLEAAIAHGIAEERGIRHLMLTLPKLASSQRLVRLRKRYVNCSYSISCKMPSQRKPRRELTQRFKKKQRRCFDAKNSDQKFWEEFYLYYSCT